MSDWNHSRIPEMTDCTRWLPRSVNTSCATQLRRCDCGQKASLPSLCGAGCLPVCTAFGSTDLRLSNELVWGVDTRWWLFGYLKVCSENYWVFVEMIQLCWCLTHSTGLLCFLRKRTTKRVIINATVMSTLAFDAQVLSGPVHRALCVTMCCTMQCLRTNPTSWN